MPSTFRSLLSAIVMSNLRQWRAIALTTPLLWRAIRINFSRDDSDKRLAAHLELMEAWLLRSRNCPLSLTLSPSLDRRSHLTNSALLPQFLQILQIAVLYCQRWEHVELCTLFQHLSFIQGEMPLLRDLKVGPSDLPGDDEPQLRLFNHAPQLETVTLTRYFLKSAMELPWAQSTHVTAECLYPDECVEILRDATHLIHFEIHDVCFSADVEDVSVSPAQSSYLRSLILHVTDNGPIDLSIVLDGLTLSALRKLRIYEPGITLNSLQLKAFIARSHCSLEELRLDYSFRHYHDSAETETLYREAFPSIPNIRYGLPVFLLDV
ncbi:hypothetical protein B0H19DRAFT_300426 [Mycena capillaripes]|nr:hypothetical protein B0H19DRAFT_300426 [Mycena capillaripes]